MTLTKTQNKGLTAFLDFLKNDEKNIALVGPAGSGKSYLASSLIDIVIKDGISMCVLCPTNKALEVIRTKYQEQYSQTIEFMTVASFLYKVKRYNKDGDLCFKLPKEKKFLTREYDILFIDESSMIEEEDFLCFQELDSKVVFIGDNCQLPPVNAKTSIVFDKVTNLIELNRIIRANNEDIKNINKKFRRIMTKKQHLTLPPNNEHVHFTESRQEFLELINEHMTNKHKLLCYTNNRVKFYNKYIRELLYKGQLYYNSKFLKGEKIMFNSHFGIFYSNQEIILEDVKVERKPHINGRTYKVYSMRVKNHPAVLNYIHENDSSDYIGYYSQLYRELKSRHTSEKEWEKYYEEKSLFMPPIDYAYCTTVHRAQGSTYSRVFIDMNDISSVASNHKDVDLERVVYTAISRASDHLYVYY